LINGVSEGKLVVETHDEHETYRLLDFKPYFGGPPLSFFLQMASATISCQLYFHTLLSYHAAVRRLVRRSSVWGGMPREANLSNLQEQSTRRLLSFESGGGNMPPRWIENARTSRRNRHDAHRPHFERETGGILVFSVIGNSLI